MFCLVTALKDVSVDSIRIYQYFSLAYKHSVDIFLVNNNEGLGH